MRSVYVRPCNFVHGKFATFLIQKKQALPICGNRSIAFTHIEIIAKKNKRQIITITEVNNLPKQYQKQVQLDLKQIQKKRTSIGKLNMDQPILMGVLNVTPDSFSDGGKFNKKNKGVSHAINLYKTGASLVDVGGESTRPGSKPVNEKQEWNRINKILKLIVKKMPISLDTRKSRIMENGIRMGVKLINDVSGLSYNPKTINILKKYKIPFVIQHSVGTPENMQKKAKYKNELLDIYDYFEDKIKLIRSKGIKHNNIILDPGIGFGKNLKHNMNLIRGVSIFHSLGFPILVGNSRKRFIKDISKKNDSKKRIGGTMASSIYLLMQGIQILRIHDVNEVKQGIKVFNEIVKN